VELSSGKWDSNLYHIWAAGLAEWGNYASFCGWWTECRNESKQKAQVQQELAKTRDDVHEQLAVYALPFFHLKHQCIAGLCSTICPHARAALASVTSKPPSDPSKTAFQLHTSELLTLHAAGRVMLKLPAQGQSIPTF
jgi:hypothetical protein